MRECQLKVGFAIELGVMISATQLICWSTSRRSRRQNVAWGGARRSRAQPQEAVHEVEQPAYAGDRGRGRTDRYWYAEDEALSPAHAGSPTISIGTWGSALRAPPRAICCRRLCRLSRFSLNPRILARRMTPPCSFSARFSQAIYTIHSHYQYGIRLWANQQPLREGE